MSTNRNTEPQDATTITSVALTVAQHETLKEMAARAHRNVSQQVRYLIEKEQRAAESELAS